VYGIGECKGVHDRATERERVTGAALPDLGPAVTTSGAAVAVVVVVVVIVVVISAAAAVLVVVHSNG
jgi:hypothetical protein